MRRFVLLLAIVVGLGVGARIAFVAAVARPLPDPGDALAYHLLGDGLADGDGYVRPFDRRDGRLLATAEYPPGFPALIAVLDVAGIDTTWGQRFATGVLGGASIALTGLVGKRLVSDGGGLIAATLVAFHPQTLQHDTTLLSEGLAVLLGAAVLLTASRRHVLAAGVAVGLASLVRADALALVPLLLVPLAALAPGARRWRAVGLAVAVPLAVVAPWILRNAVRLDGIVLVSTNAGTAVDGANCDDAYSGQLRGYWRYGPGCFEGYDTEALVALGEGGLAEHHLAEGLSYARGHLRAFPEVAVARLRRGFGLWDPDQQAFLAALEGKAASWERAGTVVTWGVLLLALLGLVAHARADRLRAWILAAPIVAAAVVIVCTYGNPRFRAASEPALAVLAATPLVLARTRSLPSPFA